MKQMMNVLKKLRDQHLYLSFTLLFIILFSFAQLPFELRDGTFSLQGYFSEPSLYFDGLKQHILFMYDYVSELKAFFLGRQDFPLYRFDIGFGGDLLISYGYYGLFDPLNIIAFILPISKIGLSYFLILSLRVYLSGLFMILLAKQLGIKKNASLLSVGIVYAFSAPILFSVYRHPFFVNGPMYLPLLIYGAERILNHKNPILFILAVFFSAISQFYFFVYVSIGFAFYLIFRLMLELREKRFSTFLSIVFYAIIGVSMAGFVLIPTLLALTEGSRTDSKGLIPFSLSEVRSILSSHFVPLKGAKYSIGIGNLFLLFSSFLYLFTKHVPHRFIRWNFLLILLLGFSSLFGFIVNGFTYVNNRWLFIIMVPVSLSFGFLIDGQVVPNLKSFKRSTMSLCFILLLIVVLNILNIYEDTSLLFMHMAVGITLLFIIKVLSSKQEVTGWQIRLFNIYHLQRVVLLTCVISLFICSSYYARIHSPKNGFDYYYPNTEVYQNFFTDETFYRVEHKIHEANFDKYSNDNLRYGFNSTYLYNSMASGSIGDYFNALEIINLNGSTGYNGLEGRSRLLALNHVRYVMIRASEKTLPPFGFTYVKSVDVPKYTNKSMHVAGGNIERQNGKIVYEKVHLYENQNFIRFGYMKYDMLAKETFDALDYLTKQEALLNYVILDEGSTDQLHPLVESPTTVIEEDIRLEDNLYQFTIPNIHHQEVYVLVEGLKKENHQSRFTVVYETKDVRLRDINAPKGTNIYRDNTTQLAHLGYYEQEENLEVTLKFSTGVYNIERISYSLMNTDNIEKKTEELNAHTLENLTFRGNGLDGTIQTPKEGYLILTIPYSKGFSATVDGISTDVLKADVGFIAIKVPEGEHEVSLTYLTPGLRQSLILFAFGSTIAFMITTTFAFRRRMRNWCVNL